MAGRDPADPTRPEKIPVVSMLAAAYSGATLFAIVLNRHPLLACDAETFPPDRGFRDRCSCGCDQVECEYYRLTAGHMLAPDGREWNDDLFAHVPRYSRSRLLDRALGGFWLNGPVNGLRNGINGLLPGLRNREREFLDAHERFIANALVAHRARVYVDGAKSFRRAELLARSERFALKAVYLVRDGRGFCASYVKNKGLPNESLPLAARLWVKANAKAERLRRRFPGVPFLRVRYEDLCTAFEPTMREVCAFIGVPYDPTLQAESGKPFHGLGNRMRSTFDGKIELDLSWKQRLSEAEVRAVTRVMEKDLVRFGYLDRRSPGQDIGPGGGEVH